MIQHNVRTNATTEQHIRVRQTQKQAAPCSKAPCLADCRNIHTVFVEWGARGWSQGVGEGGDMHKQKLRQM